MKKSKFKSQNSKKGCEGAKAGRGAKEHGYNDGCCVIASGNIAEANGDLLYSLRNTPAFSAVDLYIVKYKCATPPLQILVSQKCIAQKKGSHQDCLSP